MPQRILITGVQGFTGRYVAQEFQAQGWEVWGTGQHPSATDVNYRVADLADRASLQALMDAARPDVVLHLAALAFVGHADPAAFYEVNVIGTRNLLAAIEQSNSAIAQVVLASSANIYGNSRGGSLSEMTPANPANEYAVSKYAMELMAGCWRSRLPISITRPFNYTGVGQVESFLVPKIVAHFRARAPVIELGNLDVARDFSDVRDIARYYRRLVEALLDSHRQEHVDNPVINLCSGTTRTLRSILTAAERITGHVMDIRVNPAFVRADEVATLSGDDGRLRSLIGAVERRDFDETLEWMLNTPS